MADRERLWNAVEASEKRKDARLARETQLALPRELDREAQLALRARLRRASRWSARGMVADFAVHDVRARDGGRQPHAHVMTTTRAIDATKPLGFGGKVRAWDDKALVLAWREAWADHVNRALEAGRIAERVDHRTLEAQRLEAAAAGDFERAAELDREPEPKVGCGGVGSSSARASRPSAATCSARRSSATRSAARSTSAWARPAAGSAPASSSCARSWATRCEAFLAWGTEVAERARAFARGAMVAGAVGLAGLGLLPERDSVVPAAPPTVEAPLSLEDEIVEGVLEDLAVERRLREIEAMAQAERARVEAMGHEWADPGHVLADPDPMDRLAQVEAREAADRRREEDGARHEALDDVEDLDADVGRAERQRKEEERLAEIGATARAERAEVEGTGLERTYPPHALAIEDPPERTDATDDRVALEARTGGRARAVERPRGRDPRGAAEDGAGATRPPAALVGARGRDR